MTWFETTFELLLLDARFIREEEEFLAAFKIFCIPWLKTGKTGEVDGNKEEGVLVNWDESLDMKEVGGLEVDVRLHLLQPSDPSSSSPSEPEEVEWMLLRSEEVDFKSLSGAT